MLSRVLQGARQTRRLAVKNVSQGSSPWKQVDFGRVRGLPRWPRVLLGNGIAILSPPRDQVTPFTFADLKRSKLTNLRDFWKRNKCTQERNTDMVRAACLVSRVPQHIARRQGRPCANSQLTAAGVPDGLPYKGFELAAVAT